MTPYYSVNSESFLFLFLFLMQIPDLNFDCPGMHFKEASNLKMAILNKHMASYI